MRGSLPTVRLFLACRRIVERDGRILIDSPVHTLQPSSFPIRLPSLWFYAQVTGVETPCDLTVEVREFGSGKTISRSWKPLHVPRMDSPLDVVEARIVLTNFQVRGPDSYDFVLLSNGREVENGTYRVNVYD